MVVAIAVTGAAVSGCFRESGALVLRSSQSGALAIGSSVELGQIVKTELHYLPMMTMLYDQKIWGGFVL